MDPIDPIEEPGDEPDPGREAFLADLPGTRRERMALMTLRPKELVLAFADGAADDVAITIMSMESWEDPASAADGQYAFALKMQAHHAAGLADLAQRVAGVEVTVDVYDAEMRSALAKLTPPTHRDAVLDVFDGLAAKAEADNEPALDPDDIASVIIVAAQTARMLHDTRVWPSYPTVRTNLLREIKDLQGIALGAPHAETITKVSYDVAYDKLQSIINPSGTPGPWTMPRDPKEWGLHEIDMIETVKAHMLQYPDPTPQQHEQLRGQIGQILSRVDEYYPPKSDKQPTRTGPPKPHERRPQRTQSKRKPRAKRKKKGK